MKECKGMCYLLKLYTLFLSCGLLFLYGFFPITLKTSVEDIEVLDIQDARFNTSEEFVPAVNRLILIIIDALRYDFIDKKKMPFTSSTIHKDGCFISLLAHSPTVTLPRIKALTTGSIPQFTDVIFNLFTTESLEDSLLHQLRDVKKKIIFYGDNTWLKLYPDLFSRYEGVSSFYVSDYTEVDNNVTRNVMKELDADDWDIMILHYLGIDHIGHLEGPFSKLVIPKLLEMDEIIKKVYLASKQWNKNTLIMITGDHGMKDSGGHGGATYSETNVPLIVLGQHCKNETAMQIDVTPTLSALMGTRVPKTSIGSVIISLLNSYSLKDLLYIMKSNALALSITFTEHKDLLMNALTEHYNYLQENNIKSGEKALKFYKDYSTLAKEKLIASSVEQNINQLILSSILLVSYFILIISYTVNNSFETDFTVATKYTFIIVVLLFHFLFPYLYVMTLFVFIFLLIILYIHLKRSNMFYEIKQIRFTYFNCIFAMHSFALFSSSFIEEEHQIWYYFWSTNLILDVYLSSKKSLSKSIDLIAIFCIFRFIRKLNQTGDKWAHLPDISQWLVEEDNLLYMNIFIISSLVLLFVTNFYITSTKTTALLLDLSVLNSYIFKTFFTQSLFLYKLHWIIITIILFTAIIKNSILEGIIVVWIANSCLLLRNYNVILVPLCILTSLVLKRHVNNEDNLIFKYMLLGNVFFFCQGHSNSLASIDIAPGYVGLTNYNPFIVIFQVLCHCYTFPILCNLLLLQYCKKHERIWSLNITCRALILTFTIISVTIQRHHLFIWTVFAPKLLIEINHSIVLFIQSILCNLKCLKFEIFLNKKIKNFLGLLLQKYFI